jgi:hypothetical protein
MKKHWTEEYKLNISKKYYISLRDFVTTLCWILFLIFVIEAFIYSPHWSLAVCITFFSSILFYHIMMFRSRKLDNPHASNWCHLGFHKLKAGPTEDYHVGTGRYLNNVEITRKKHSEKLTCKRAFCQYKHINCW